MNYVLVITLYPAILIIHHSYIKSCENACLCCFCNLFSRNKDDEPPVPKDADPNESDRVPPAFMRQLSEEEQAEEYRCFEQFLGRKWSKYITKYRYYTLGFFGILFILAAIAGSQMEAQSEDERWFADEHFMQKSIDKFCVYIFINSTEI